MKIYVKLRISVVVLKINFGFLTPKMQFENCIFFKLKITEIAISQEPNMIFAKFFFCSVSTSSFYNRNEKIFLIIQITKSQSTKDQKQRCHYFGENFTYVYIFFGLIL